VQGEDIPPAQEAVADAESVGPPLEQEHIPVDELEPVGPTDDVSQNVEEAQLVAAEVQVAPITEGEIALEEQPFIATESVPIAVSEDVIPPVENAISEPAGSVVDADAGSHVIAELTSEVVEEGTNDLSNVDAVGSPTPQIVEAEPTVDSVPSIAHLASKDETVADPNIPAPVEVTEHSSSSKFHLELDDDPTSPVNATGIVLNLIPPTPLPTTSFGVSSFMPTEDLNAIQEQSEEEEVAVENAETKSDAFSSVENHGSGIPASGIEEMAGLESAGETDSAEVEETEPADEATPAPEGAATGEIEIKDAQSTDEAESPAIAVPVLDVPEVAEETAPTEEERPRSPWTPSYGVTTQGAGVIPESDIGAPTLDHTAEESHIAEPDAPGAPVLPATPESPKGVIVAALSTDTPFQPEVESGAAHVEPAPTVIISETPDTHDASTTEVERPRSASPWTPSYSVTTQGPGVVPESEIEEVALDGPISGEPPAETEANTEDVVQQSVADFVTEREEPAPEAPAEPLAEQAVTEAEMKVEPEQSVAALEIKEIIPAEPEKLEVPVAAPAEQTELSLAANEASTTNVQPDTVEVTETEILPLTTEDSTANAEAVATEAPTEEILTENNTVEDTLSDTTEQEQLPEVLQPPVLTEEILTGDNTVEDTLSATAEQEQLPEVLQIPVLTVSEDESSAATEIIPHSPVSSIERLKSPWTPSYSVTNQGPGIVPEAEIAELELDGRKDSPAVPLAVSEAEEVLLSYSICVEGWIIHVSQASQSSPHAESPRPKSPWTPSYSVHAQGSPLQPVPTFSLDEDAQATEPEDILPDQAPVVSGGSGVEEITQNEESAAVSRMSYRCCSDSNFLSLPLFLRNQQMVALNRKMRKSRKAAS
jgi:hypothetical protein